jgi:glycyl-tRNA synthetase
MEEIDAAILMNPKVWEASGHVASFADPLVDCKKCKQRFRADKLIEEKINTPFPVVRSDFSEAAAALYHSDELITQLDPWEEAAGVDLSLEKNAIHDFLERIRVFKSKYSLDIPDRTIMKLAFALEKEATSNNRAYSVLLQLFHVVCPVCGAYDWSESRNFNIMFKAQQGVIEGEKTDVYLRPETAQGIFVNFKNVLQTMRRRLPFGIAQIGKAFRNEITPGNFTFRTREFEQMEIEYFVQEKDWEKTFEEWKKLVWEWYISLGIVPERLRIREHEKDELSHYSKRTLDIEYQFPWGWGELFGLAYRTNFDLSQHEKFSGQDLSYTDPDDPKKKILPHVIEPSFGVDRTILVLLLEAYTEDEAPSAKGGKEKRLLMKLNPRIAPYDCAVLPLSKSEKLIAKAEEIYHILLTKTHLKIEFDITGSIGKRYRRQDEIGTPTCITVDFGTIGEDEKQSKRDHVTVRDRDTLRQEEVGIDELVAYLSH